MATVTLYESLVNRMWEAAKEHPRSYVVVDVPTGKLLGHGMNVQKVLAAVKGRLEEGQVPMVFKLPRPGEVRIS